MKQTIYRTLVNFFAESIDDLTDIIYYQLQQKALTDAKELQRQELQQQLDEMLKETFGDDASVEIRLIDEDELFF